MNPKRDVLRTAPGMQGEWEREIEVHPMEGPEFNLAKFIPYLSIAPHTKMVVLITNREDRG
jgi:hypothetical protein